MDTEKKYRCTMPVQMRFKDIDMFRHVNNTVYLEYLDLGKVRYIETVLGPMFDTRSKALVIANINVSFLAPTLHDEQVEVRTRVESIGTHSLTFGQQVVNPATGQVKCEATVVMVAFDAATASTYVIPDQWRQAIGTYEAW